MAGLMNDYMASSDESDHSDDIRSADSDFLNELHSQRVPRDRPTYQYDGDLLINLQNDSDEPTRRWADLPEDVQHERWKTHFRMLPDTFEELLVIVQLHMRRSVARNLEYRTHSAKASLLVTLYFLAHCPTLRTLATQFNIPPSSLSVSILKPTLYAIRQALYEEEQTRNVNFPVTAPELQAASLHSQYLQ